MNEESKNSGGTDFARQAQMADPGFVADMWAFLRHNKKWWLTPIILCIVLVGLIVVLSGTAAAPFIYALF